MVYKALSNWPAIVTGYGDMVTHGEAFLEQFLLEGKSPIICSRSMLVLPPSMTLVYYVESLNGSFNIKHIKVPLPPLSQISLFQCNIVASGETFEFDPTRKLAATIDYFAKCLISDIDTSNEKFHMRVKKQTTGNFQWECCVSFLIFS
mgnify:CR=1 FL=1